MVKFKIQITENITAGLDHVENKVREKVLLSGAATMAKVIYDEAKLNASRNVKTGMLRDAIYRVYAKDKSSDNEVTYEISWNKTVAPHGHLIEFGTSRAPAYPFIRPAFDHMDQAIQSGQRRMQEVMKSSTKGSS
jgi:HK97 gp10 family phage protein